MRMLRLAAAVAALTIIGSPFLAWIAAPIQGGISGASLGAYLGWMIPMVGAIGGAAWWFRQDRVFTLCGVVGTGLCGFFLIHLALGDPLLWSLIDENVQYAGIMNFSRRYLPANMGIEPTFRADLAADTLGDRLGTAVHFTAWGWWAFLSGSLLAVACGLKAGGLNANRWAIVAAVVLFVGEGFMLARGVAAQYEWDAGDRHAARGAHAQAMAKYETALRWDPRIAWNERTQREIGAVYADLRMTTQPVARFYLSDRYAREGRLEAAVSEYLSAAGEASSPLKEIIERRVARIYIDLGLAQHRKGNAGQAIDWWERALAYDSTQIHAAYVLTRVYFDQGRDEQSIAMGRLLLSRSRNRLLNANVEANLGDAYWRLHEFQSARTAYEASMELDSYANFRIFKSLGGT